MRISHNAVQMEPMQSKPQRYVLDVREMAWVRPHSDRLKGCEREGATTVEGTVLHVKAKMTGVMLIVVGS